jgi:hypothetical protein
MIKINTGLHVKEPLFLLDFNDTWICSTDFWKNVEIQNYVKIFPVGAELFHAERGTDGQIDNFAKALKNWWVTEAETVRSIVIKQTHQHFNTLHKTFCNNHTCHAKNTYIFLYKFLFLLWISKMKSNCFMITANRMGFAKETYNFQIRTVQHLDIIKVLFILQLMH